METLQATSIADMIHGAQRQHLESQIKRSRWKSIRASGIGDECERRIFYYITCGELADEMTPELIAIFGEGREQEPGVRRYLSELGFEIKRAGATEEMKSCGISGECDGTLDYNGEKYLVEIKTVSEYAWDALNTPEDFNEGYYKKWLAQINIYMLLFGYEQGLFILKRKQAKQIKIIEVKLDYVYAESLLKRAERITAALKANTPPDFLKNNPVECKKCPFFSKVCNPPMDFGQTAIIEDTVIEQKLSRRDALDIIRKEFEKLDKDIKERFKGIPAAICGNYAINGKETTIKYKAQEAREIKGWKTDIKKIQDVTEEIISSSRRG